MSGSAKARFRIEPLGRQDRRTFACGVEALDRYFHTQVTQDIRRRVAACYVAVEQASDQLAGFYTLAAGQVALSDLPNDTRRRLPRYPAVPVVRLGRLAVHQGFNGAGLGSALVVDAASRSLRADIAAFAMVVDAKDEGAATFYRHLGFRDLNSDNRSLFIALARLAERLGTTGFGTEGLGTT